MVDDYDVVILGAGYAGLMSAARLAGRSRRRRLGLRIALVSGTDRFVERLRIHEFLTSRPVGPTRPLDIRAYADDLGVTFIETRASKIDRAARTVHLDGAEAPRAVRYVRLVLALGTRIDVDMVAGAGIHAYRPDVEGRRAMLDLRSRLRVLAPDEKAFVVVGGGATGIELAAELTAIEGAQVRLVTSGTFGDFATSRVRRKLKQALARIHVEITEHVEVRTVAKRAILTSVGEIGFDLCVWCTGFRGHEVIIRSGLKTDEQGRVLVDQWLRSEDAAVYVAGDACLPVGPVGAPPRMSVLFALVTGAHVADVIVSEYRCKPARALNFATYGQAIQVRENAVGFGTFPADRQIGPIYTRRIAYHLRSFFVALLFGLLKWEKRFPGFPFWLSRPGFRTATRRPGDPPARTEAQH